MKKARVHIGKNLHILWEKAELLKSSGSRKVGLSQSFNRAA